MSDYSIEYSHIYTDDQFNGNHLASVQILKSIEKEISGLGKTVSRTVLVDNCSPTKKTLDIVSFIKKLKQLEAEPKYLFMEKDLVPYALKTLNLVNKDRKRKEYEKYIKEKNIIPCSLFIAAWYLVRLGILKYNENEFEKSDNLITILPSHFIGVEKKAKEIIAATDYKNILKKIKLIFFDASVPIKKYKLI